MSAPGLPPVDDRLPSDDDHLFLPVPVTPRSDGWTPGRQRLFIRALAALGGLAAAARAAGMTAQSANRLRRRADAASFAAA